MRAYFIIPRLSSVNRRKCEKYKSIFGAQIQVKIWRIHSKNLLIWEYTHMSISCKGQQSIWKWPCDALQHQEIDYCTNNLNLVISFNRVGNQVLPVVKFSLGCEYHLHCTSCTLCLYSHKKRLTDCGRWNWSMYTWGRILSTLGRTAFGERRLDQGLDRTGSWGSGCSENNRETCRKV